MVSNTFVGVGVALGVPLLLCLLSLGCVEQNEYGLVFNWVTKAIGSDVYHGGTHLIGFWNTFVTFPATVQTIEFSPRNQGLGSGMLHTRTKEGLGLHLSIAFQYQLLPERLPQLYQLTNQAYEGLYRRVARDQLLEAASEYEGPEYWLKRHQIGSHMRQLVDSQLRESYAKVWGLQLLVIDLPDRYEHAITLTQVQQQKIKTRRNEQAAARIRADTEVLQAEYKRQIQVVDAGALANYTLQTKLARAEATGRKIAAEVAALRYLREKLGLTPKGAVEYQELNAYGELPNATLLANIAEARAVVGVGGALPAAAYSFSQLNDTRHRSAGHRDSGGAGDGPATVEAPSAAAADGAADIAAGDASRAEPRRLRRRAPPQPVLDRDFPSGPQ